MPINSFKTFVTRLVRFGLRRKHYDNARTVVKEVDIFNFTMKMEDRLKLYYETDL